MTDKEIELREIFKSNLIRFSPINESTGIEYTDEELEIKIDEMISYEKNNTMKWIELRESRTRKLQSCDWTQLPDSKLSDDLKAEWANYRQLLRDLPSNTEFPAYPDFPRFPGEIRPEDEDFIQDIPPGDNS